MTEEFLYHLWQHRLFNQEELISKEGFRVRIIHPGTRNLDSGPDFFNARICIDGTEWAGNIEIHVCASDWIKHGHDSDDAYDSCILHVVYKADREIFRKDGNPVPTIELSDKFHAHLWENYRNLLKNTGWIPCHKHIREVNQITVKSFIERVAIERLEYKTGNLNESLSLNKGDWEETFYQLLARNFGFRVNSLPFEMLARSIPYRLIQKYIIRQNFLDALFFGQSGLIVNVEPDDYVKQMSIEYNYFANLHRLKTMNASSWKFLRLRPMNFPTIRIAQFSNLLFRQTKLLSRILEIKNLADAMLQFKSSASGYWNHHYQFGKISQGTEKVMGLRSIENILINTVIPFLFAWGRKNGSQDHCERALELLSQLKSEDNEVVRKWIAHGIDAQSALESQALLHLKKYYCDEKKCLDCSIGNKLIAAQDNLTGS